ncbi:MAG: PEP/pyruvate-binding domain-containing protein [Deltaproteobacteria bacterium]|nr:PEP/pyruvate-binding domain-containing protein [Deltaproteobacteria bacterium]
MPNDQRVSTGFPDIDNILDGLRIGDNVVWKVDRIEDYQHFVTPFVNEALKNNKNVVYMRFGQHEPLVSQRDGITIYELDAYCGFEAFATRVHQIITDEGVGTFYVFDCLTDILSAWATDRMLGNFFRITCPYLFELDTVAYFSFKRESLSLKSVAKILKTTQLLLNIPYEEGQLQFQPIKVWQRHSPTMFLPHIRNNNHFVPVTNSYEATDMLRKRRVSTPSRHLDHWHHLFMRAETLLENNPSDAEKDEMVCELCRHIIGREPRVLQLAQKYFSLEGLLKIKSRIIGTGYIGGKSVGMLLARKILQHDNQRNWDENLEHHDSFYVGSDVYFSYLIHNGWWKLFMEQKTDDGYYRCGAELHDKLLHGEFSEDTKTELKKMLDYYGQYPIIVRSSSLLEDSFGNAFAGKYDSFFCVNQGSPEQRYQDLESAIRQVFSSAMSQDALTYRKQRGLDKKEEQMALLIMRVSGSYRGKYYFPELAGVGVSHNTFVWDKEMDPTAGMLRLVLGMGTRAVDRVEGDYPRIVALDYPLKKPYAGFDDARRFAQRDVDLLNITDNALQTISLLQLNREIDDIPMEKYAVRDYETMQLMEQRSNNRQDAWLLNFDQLLSETPFSTMMQQILKTLEKAYDYPIDIEFTVNMVDEQPKINIVQCRPLQTQGHDKRVNLPENVNDSELFLSTKSNFMGGNISRKLNWLIWVEPEEYVKLSTSAKHDIARLIGRINKRVCDRKDNQTLLMGPGRWGTSTPELGVPIRFAEISNITALCEVAFTTGGLMPELSFGSHFFQDLVEADIFYLALFPEKKGIRFDKEWLDQQRNSLEGILPSYSKYKRVVKVVKLDQPLQLMSDIISQRLICLYKHED